MGINFKAAGVWAQTQYKTAYASVKADLTAIKEAASKEERNERIGNFAVKITLVAVPALSFIVMPIVTPLVAGSGAVLGYFVNKDNAYAKIVNNFILEYTEQMKEGALCAAIVSAVIFPPITFVGFTLYVSNKVSQYLFPKVTPQPAPGAGAGAGAGAPGGEKTV
jgi:hypothetical protein